VLPALEPRGAVVADLRVGGAELRVVGMHLDLSGLWRRRQARAVIEQMAAQPAPMPTVLMGDLNEWRQTDGCIRDFGSCYQVLPTAPTFHAKRPIARLDRIIVSPDLSAQATGVHHSAKAQIASDHLPVWARLMMV
jgi:endonuclease/exonuclease/phosphatase family metal-dependent hydrolase